jgi:hypothetical protein
MALLNEKSFEDLCANMLKNCEVRRDLRSHFGATVFWKENKP